MNQTSIAAQSVVSHCRAIARFSDEPGSTTRTFLSPAMRDCLDYLSAWANRIGMTEVRVDDAGNFRAVLKGQSKRRVVIGSHLDSVPNAGAFDGVLGVVLGLSIAESCQEQTLPCTLEVVGFSEEEGVRFKQPFIGSIAYLDGLSHEFLSLSDGAGTTVKDALTQYGLDASAATVPQMDVNSVAYLELHIEQGPVLESLNMPLGVVDEIVGQTRATADFIGKANHAGTTPMNLRQDAFCAASEWTLKVEKMARETAGLVATVGSVHVSPGAGNVIPERATLSLDVRHASDEIRTRAVEQLLRSGHEIAHQRDVAFTFELRLSQTAVPMNDALVKLAHNAVEAVGVVAHHMGSGAGHDAMIVAKRLPSAMIFLRSPGGISHHPDEVVLVEDVELALQAGRYFVENFV